MKKNILLSVLFCLVAINTYASEVFQNYIYLYTGTFQQMTQSLEESLALKIKEKCRDPQSVRINKLVIEFQKGFSSSGKGLPTQVLEKNESTILSFPSHPLAKIATSFDCK